MFVAMVDGQVVGMGDEFSVVTSYDMNAVQGSATGIDVLVNAKTTFPAVHVTILAVSDTEENKSYDMHG